MNQADFNNTRVISNNFAEEVNALRKEDGSEIPVFGSPRATHSLSSENLIDGFWLFVNPVVLGEGIPLFKGVKQKITLSTDGTKEFSNGVVEMKYAVAGK